jgi:hypothetical protein
MEAEFSSRNGGTYIQDYIQLLSSPQSFAEVKACKLTKHVHHKQAIESLCDTAFLKFSMTLGFEFRLLPKTEPV